MYATRTPISKGSSMRLPTRPALAATILACAGALAACPDDPTLTNDLGWVKGVDGAGTVVIDATSEDAWVYFSFATGAVVKTPEKPGESLAWDIAFQRYNMKTNGGVSGKGQGAAADL